MNINAAQKNPEIFPKKQKSSGILTATHIKNKPPGEAQVIHMAEKKPDAKFRAGAVCATVWMNDGTSKDGQPRTFASVSFDKSYKDKDGTWKSTKTLNVQDLPKAALVLNKAYEHLALRDVDDVAAGEA